MFLGQSLVAFIFYVVWSSFPSCPFQRTIVFNVLDSFSLESPERFDDIAGKGAVGTVHTPIISCFNIAGDGIGGKKKTDISIVRSNFSFHRPFSLVSVRRFFRVGIFVSSCVFCSERLHLKDPAASAMMRVDLYSLSFAATSYSITCLLGIGRKLSGLCFSSFFWSAISRRFLILGNALACLLGSGKRVLISNGPQNVWTILQSVFTVAKNL